MEIIIIIIVIAIIFLFLSGGFPLMTAEEYDPAARQLAASQYKCEEVVWTTAPNVQNDIFNGTMELRCEFEGLRGVGLVELRKHMLAKLPETAEKIHAGPIVENFEGLPSVAYDVTLKMKAKKETVLVRGKTHIATDGFTQIRNVFVSDQPADRGLAAKYLKGVRNEISVESTDRPNWYRIRVKNTAKLAKPPLISKDKFQRVVVEKSEEQFQQKALQAMSAIANEL